jgi:sporulation-control protein spo0M
MSATLQIELDRGPWEGDVYERSWPIGGQITGHLIVTSDNGQRATNLRVELEWETSGRGTRDHKRVTQQILHEGDVPALANLRLPFKLAVPAEGPITHHGHYITIQWQIVGRIDISWAIDKTTKEQVTILPIYDQA